MITYDGFDLSDYLLVIDIGRPLMPPQELTTKAILGRNGVYFIEKKHGPVVIPVEVMIYEDLGMTYSEMKRFLAEKLNKKSPKRLIFHDEPDRYIDAIIQDETEIRNLIQAGQGTLNFFCPDPYYYAIEDEVFTYNGPGGFNFTRAKGNEESEPLIEIEGTNSGGAITIKTDNTEIVFDGRLSTGEILVLDSHFITAYVIQTNGSQRSANNDIDNMTFPILQVGANHVEIQCQGNATVNTVRIYARSRWI